MEQCESTTTWRAGVPLQDKAIIRCALPAGHVTNHAATIADSEPQATVVWEKED